MRWILLVTLLALPTAQAAWQDTIWWGQGDGEDVWLDRNGTEGAAPSHTIADYAGSADAPQPPHGVSWLFRVERQANETVHLAWGAPLHIVAAFSTHTTRVHNQDPPVDEEVPGAGMVELAAVLRVDGRDMVRAPAKEVEARNWTEVAWTLPNPLHGLPAGADVELVVSAAGPASQYRLGLSEATGWTRLLLPVLVPPPPVDYNQTTAVGQQWQMSWSETMANLTNRSHVATWSSAGAAVIDVETQADNGTAWVAIRDSDGQEIFNGTSAHRRIVSGAPGNWTIEVRATGFAGTVSWTIADLEGPPMEVPRPREAPPAVEGSTSVDPAQGGTPVTEWKPAKPIDNQEAPLPWWPLLAVLGLAGRRR